MIFGSLASPARDPSHPGGRAPRRWFVTSGCRGRTAPHLRARAESAAWAIAFIAYPHCGARRPHIPCRAGMFTLRRHATMRRRIGWLLLLGAVLAALFAVLAFFISLGAGIDDNPDNNHLVEPWFIACGFAFVTALGLLGTGVTRIQRERRERGPLDTRRRAEEAGRSSDAHPDEDDDPIMLGYVLGIVIGLVMILAITGAATGSGDTMSGIVFGLTLIGMAIWVLGLGVAFVSRIRRLPVVSASILCYIAAAGLAAGFGEGF